MKIWDIGTHFPKSGIYGTSMKAVYTNLASKRPLSIMARFTNVTITIIIKAANAAECRT